MYSCINGWTKNKMLKVLKARRYNVAAINEDRKECLYLTPNGNKCAVGLFIPSGHCGQHDRGSVRGLIENYPELKSSMPLSMKGLEKFQSVHDDEKNKENAKSAMIEWVKKNVK